MTRISLLTLGCKANQADTAMIAEALSGAEVDFVGPRDAADIVVINTCTVTHTADADARQLVRAAHRRCPDARIVVTGCYAQMSGDELRAMPEVSHVVGNADKASLPALLRELSGLAAEPTPRHREWAPSLRDAARIRALPEGKSRPFVKIQDGCDYVCSYCIIPAARGKNRSLPLDEVTETIRRYGQLGAKEVVLTGIHVGHFGRDMRPRRNLLDLLKIIEAERLVPRVRISSIEPNELRTDLLDFAAASETVCPHFHVPLQSGSDEVLRQMRRVYTTRFYAGMTEAIRARMPHAALGIDVIVGFPGETARAFDETVRFLRSLDFTYLHVFPYSPRAGTDAAMMVDQVPPEEKKERGEILRQLSDERRQAYYQSQVGRDAQMLVEERRARSGRLRGFTETYVAVELDGPDALRDTLQPVRLLQVRGDRVDCEVIREEGDAP